MGGLHRKLWQTHIVFLMGVLAIAGFPRLLGLLLEGRDPGHGLRLAACPAHRCLHAIGLVTAGLTAFYMFRLYFVTFWGECRAPREVREHLHDAAPVVINPLWVLAFLSVFAGLGGLPQVVGRSDRRAETRTAWAISWRRRWRRARTTRSSTRPSTGWRRSPWAPRRRARCSRGCSTRARPGLPARLAAALSGLHRLLAPQVLDRRALRRADRAPAGARLRPRALPRHRRRADRRRRRERQRAGGARARRRTGSSTRRAGSRRATSSS